MNIATRDSLGAALVEVGAIHPDVVVFGLDLKGATRTQSFRDHYPDRFFEMGIAEANGISTSAGMALAGFRPFIASFAAFLTGRYDMIRQSVCGNRAGVVLVGTHAGLAIGKDGATQMGLEDIALMRVLPGMTIIQPADDIETHQCVRYLAEQRQPCYLRICRQPVPAVNGAAYRFQFGKGVVLREGCDVTLFGTGGTVHAALGAAELLERDGVQARVVNMHTLKPLDSALVLRCAAETSALLSIEDHSIVGGMGSAIAEVLACSRRPIPPFKIHGVPDVFGESGDPDELYRNFRLDSAGIRAESLRLIG